MKIDEKIKKQAENLYRSGNHSGREIARMLKIGESTVRAWARAGGWKKDLKGSENAQPEVRNENPQSAESATPMREAPGAKSAKAIRESDMNGDLEKSQHVPNRETLICEICGQELARFDPEKVKLPLRADMFQPINPDLGLPPSWVDESVFEWKCFYPNHSPFIARFDTADDADPNRWPLQLKTPNGYHVIN